MSIKRKVGLTAHVTFDSCRYIHVIFRICMEHSQPLVHATAALVQEIYKIITKICLVCISVGKISVKKRGDKLSDLAAKGI